MISEQTIHQAAQLLGEAAKPAKVILFGSYARGDAQEIPIWISWSLSRSCKTNSARWCA